MGEKAVYTNADGSERTIEIAASPIFTTDHNVNGAILVWHDVTETETARDYLVRYQMLFEHTQEIIIFVRLADGKILEANRAAERAYGYSREELLDLAIRDLRAAPDNVQIQRQLESAFQTGIVFETIHRRKDGSTFPVEVSSQGADLHGQRIALSIIRDISERK